MQINTRKKGVERIRLTKRERKTLSDALLLLADIGANALDVEPETQAAVDGLENVIQALEKPVASTR